MWKQAVSFPGYEASESGEVRNVKTKHVLSQQVNNRGYLIPVFAAIAIDVAVAAASLKLVDMLVGCFW